MGGADILHWGGRGFVALFFCAGASALMPPPAPDLAHGMLATSFAMIGLVLSMLVEILSVYLKWLDPFTRRKGKKARQEFSQLSRDIFSTIGLAANTVGQVTRATGGGRVGRRKRRR